MRNRVVIAIFVGLVVVVVALVVSFSGARAHDPKDLSYWMRAGAAKDWSSEAAQGAAQAQFHFGLSLIRTNLLTMIDRVPRLSAVPLVGKRFFEKISYGITAILVRSNWRMPMVGSRNRPTRVLLQRKRCRNCSSEESEGRTRAVQRTGASRFAQRQIQRHRRLAPVADLLR